MQQQTDRRKAPRVKCKYPCELRCSGTSAQGVVLDMSESGLSIRTAMDLEQGDSLAISVKLPKTVIEVSALLWHCRSGRSRQTGETFSVLGLMVTDPPDAYLGLFPSREAAKPPAPAPPEPAPVRKPAKAAAGRCATAAPPEPAPAQPPPPTQAMECDDEESAEEPTLRAYRIRVKHRAGPRTRILSLSAESQDEANALARAQLEQEWEVLEVSAA